MCINDDDSACVLGPDCPRPVNVTAIVLGVIGGVILLGLLLLALWKIFVTIHDRQEYAKFERDRQKAQWDTVSIFNLLPIKLSLA